MEIVSIEKKTFEELVSRLGQFVKRMDSINRQLGGKILYRESDIERVLQSCYRGKFWFYTRWGVK